MLGVWGVSQSIDVFCCIGRRFSCATTWTNTCECTNTWLAPSILSMILSHREFTPNPSELDLIKCVQHVSHVFRMFLVPGSREDTTQKYSINVSMYVCVEATSQIPARKFLIREGVFNNPSPTKETRVCEPLSHPKNIPPDGSAIRREWRNSGDFLRKTPKNTYPQNKKETVSAFCPLNY